MINKIENELKLEKKSQASEILRDCDGFFMATQKGDNLISIGSNINEEAAPHMLFSIFKNFSEKEQQEFLKLVEEW